MYFIYNAFLNKFKNNKFYLIFKRRVRNTPLIFNEDSLEYGNKPKDKISVVKRKFIQNKEKSTIIEWKSASSVIKRLNWENKHLFGPVQTSKVNSYNVEEVSEANEIIQHETRIPIVELQNEEKKCDLHSIMAFPLLNKSVHSTSKINEVNCLRQHLEFLCKNLSTPSVTQILQRTMPLERVKILDKWKQNMISQLGKEGFERYQTEMLANGVSLHHSISTYLSSTPESELCIKEENIGHWKSLKHVLPDIKNVKLLEEFVTHPFLCYRGVVDCFAKYKDHLVVIDWKTSKKSKALIKNTYDDPLQIAAYVGALNFDPKFQYLACKGLIAIAYENGMPATTHLIDESTMMHYWNEWLKRVKQFWEMKNSETESS